MIKPKTEKTCADPECGSTFVPRTTLQKYCSFKCTAKNTEKDVKQKTRLKRSSKPIRKKSKKQSANDRKYTIVRREFFKNPANKKCRVILGAYATEIHHMMGREGFADDWARDNDIPLLIDTRFFLPVCRDGHEEIENNPVWAKKKGFSLDRLAVPHKYKIK